MNERRKNAITSAALLCGVLVYVRLLSRQWRLLDVSLRHFFNIPLGQGLTLALFALAILFLGGLAMLFGAWATEEREK